MSVKTLSCCLMLGCITACGGGADRVPRDAPAVATRGSRAGDSCQILTPADIRELTGAEVHLIARGASAGAGGTCGNYATADGDAFLGVNALQGASEYGMAIGAVPADVYPKRENLAGLGDEAVLMKDDTGMLRYLVARKADRGVVLFPLGRAGRALSDAQLGQLAERALAAR